MSAAVWDAENGGAPATAAVAAAAAAAESSAENWEPASQAGIGGGIDSAGGSGYPETKDNGEDAAANLFGNDIPGEDGGTGGGGPAVVIASVPPAADGVVGTGGGLGTRGSAAGTAFASGTSTLTKRRNSMAFEIARVERAGKAALASPEKAKRAWELSRPRFVEESSVHGPAMGGSGGVEGGRAGKRRARLPPGQENRDAVPYGVWSTSWAQMGDFGLDVGMYFVTLAQLVGAVLVYAALCVVAMVHFASENYSEQQAGVRADLRGSAVCTASKEVLVYPRDSWDFRNTFDRNDCPLDSKQGYADMAGVLLLFMLLLLLGKAQEKAAEYTATQIHSAQPYTVKVSSPDPLADDPDRWRRLFAQFGHVSYVTVARGNGSLLRAMADRRAAGRRLESSTPDVAEIVEAYRSVDTNEPPTSGAGGWWKAFLRPFGFFRDTKFWTRELWDAHRRVEGEIMKGMHDQGLPVVKVFVTFESDLSQARCLSHMSRGILDAPEEQHMYTNPDGFKTALHVMPASPASEVLYENLHIGTIHRIAAQVLTFVLTTMIVIISFVAARELETVGVVATALVITVVDVVLPPLVRLICSVEKHHNSVSHDLSVMNKLTLARWANLAGIPFWLNDRLGTLTEDNLELVVTVLWLNAFVPTFIRLLDIRGRWSRRVLAKKEVLQAAMDSHLEGSRFHLSDRYTDTTKTVFACLAYAPVLPIAMWIGLLSLVFSYWSDKWLFVKAWRTPQPPGNSGRVAGLARRHLALAVLAHCVFALYYYAGWPFDRICRFEQGWIECSQEGTGLIEAETQAWMTGPQKTLVDVFSALNVAWLVILLVFYYLQSIMRGISLVVKGAPRKLRSRQHMPFSQLTSRYQHDVDAYVPQIKSSHQPLPLLACDLDFVEPETIPWEVDGHKGDSFEDYCLSSSRDMPRTSRYQRARLFSLCVHYPPPAPFEAIGNGLVSKTDIDWFRRPPHPGLQETKIPEMGEASRRRQQQQPPPQQQQQQRGLRQRGNDDTVDMGSMPGLVDQDYASQHPQSQARDLDGSYTTNESQTSSRRQSAKSTSQGGVSPTRPTPSPTETAASTRPRHPRSQSRDLDGSLPTIELETSARRQQQAKPSSNGGVSPTRPAPSPTETLVPTGQQQQQQHPQSQARDFDGGYTANVHQTSAPQAKPTSSGVSLTRRTLPRTQTHTPAWRQQQQQQHPLSQARGIDGRYATNELETTAPQPKPNGGVSPIPPDRKSPQQHPQSQAPLDSNGPQQSIYRSSVASAEGERVPMLPGGAQSSLVSTAIVAADAMRVRGTPGRGEEEDDGSDGVGGGGGSSAGKTMDASAEGAAAEGDFGDCDMVSGLSDRSGRSTLQRSRDQGDHASDIHPGEGADEYAIRRSGSGNRPTRFSNGMANGTGGVGGAGGAAATASNGGSGGARGERGEEDLDMPELATPRDGEDEDMSFYDGNSRLEEEVVDNFADIPTPAPRGAGARGSGAVAGADGRTFRTQRSNSSEGWVDQYTSSSLVVSKAAPSASSQQQQQQQQQQQAAAKAARGGAS